METLLIACLVIVVIVIFAVAQSGNASIQSRQSAQLVCPHCQTKGSVTTRRVKLRTGTLTLDFTVAGQGSEISPQTGSEFGFFTNYGSEPYSAQVFQCTSGICTWTENRTLQLTIPVVFGVPFLFTEEYDLSAVAEDAPESEAVAIGSVSMTGFSVVDSNGDSVADAQLITLPEPASFVLLGSSLALLIGKFVFGGD